METILNNQDFNVRVLQATVRQHYSVHVSKHKIYRAKKKALAAAGVDHEESYKMIRNYAQVILENIFDALVVVKVNKINDTDTKTAFDRFMVGFPTAEIGSIMDVNQLLALTRVI